MKLTPRSICKVTSFIRALFLNATQEYLTHSLIQEGSTLVIILRLANVLTGLLPNGLEWCQPTTAWEPCYPDSRFVTTTSLTVNLSFLPHVQRSHRSPPQACLPIDGSTGVYPWSPKNTFQLDAEGRTGLPRLHEQ